MNNSIRFAQFTGCPFGRTGTDLTVDPWSQSVVLETLRRYFRLQTDGVYIEGIVDDGISKSLHIILLVDGEFYQDYSIQSIIHGTVRVHLPPAEHIRQDPFKKLADAWLKILGFPKEYPRSVEIDIRQDGLLRLEVCPSF
jgi:hypothetical protein